MKILPVFISIPHGGDRVPSELLEKVCINAQDLHDDSDAYTIEIFNLDTKVQQVVYTTVARAFVDLNRSPDDRPPNNSDGVVKSATCYDKPIYKSGSELSDELTNRLLEKYYFPYHELIKIACKRTDIRLGLDCHSMASVPPVIAPDSSVRPTICLGNVNGQSCSFDTIEVLADCFREVFSLEKREVSLNKPFSGGYITGTYGNRPWPWIQIEFNRSMYLSQPWFDRDNLVVDQMRLKSLNNLFEKTLRMFFTRLSDRFHY